MWIILKILAHLKQTSSIKIVSGYNTVSALLVTVSLLHRLDF